MGKYGVQKDRVDKSALGWEHKEKVEKHASQTDGSKGFGGKFGVESDRIDKMQWDGNTTRKSRSTLRKKVQLQLLWLNH